MVRMQFPDCKRLQNFKVSTSQTNKTKKKSDVIFSPGCLTVDLVNL